MNHDASRPLEDLLDREIELARHLADALAAERAALTGNSPDDLAVKTAAKCAIFAQFERLEEERRELCIAADQPLPPPAGDPSASGLAPAVAARWHSLLALMTRCRSANEINGHIIHVRQGQIRQLIDIVRGGPAMTYGPRGKTFATALRALARA
jgi:flagellar biosynthesis/type III secretory pathway chaperone